MSLPTSYEPSRRGSWADHLFNPWVSDEPCLASAFGSVADLHIPQSASSAMAWHASATAFAAYHGRPPRVFAGPCCWPLELEDPARKTGFERLIAQTPALDWFVVARDEHLRAACNEKFIRATPKNLWLGVKLDDPTTANTTLASLVDTNAKRFAVIDPAAGDFGDLHLDGLHWIIICCGYDINIPSPETIASIKLQALGIPVWIDWAPAYSFAEKSVAPFSVQEEPRRG